MFFTIVSDPDDEFGSENERYILKLDKVEGNGCFFSEREYRSRICLSVMRHKKILIRKGSLTAVSNFIGI